MNKEKAETSLENYQALSELYSNMRKELERTRKALGIAINAMKSAGTHNSINCIVRGEDPSKDDVGITINRALNKITALEQKDE